LLLKLVVIRQRRTCAGRVAMFGLGIGHDRIQELVMESEGGCGDAGPGSGSLCAAG
jgi:hypothetical protein